MTAFVASSTAVGTSGSGTLTLPTWTIDKNGHDRVFVAVTVDTATDTIATPTGFSLLLGPTLAATSQAPKLYVFFKTAVSGDSAASVTITRTGTGAWSSQARVYSGVGFIDACSIAGNGATATNNIPIPSLLPNYRDAVEVGFWAWYDSSGTGAATFTAPSGWSNRGGQSPIQSPYVDVEGWDSVNSGTTEASGTGSSTNSTLNYSVGVRIALAPSGVVRTRADRFNRGNSTTTLGFPWTALVGTWGVNTHLAYQPSGSGMAVVDLGCPDATVSVKLSTVSNSFTGLAFRVIDGSNFWTAEAGQLRRANPGGSIRATYGPAVSGDTLSVVTSGDNITVLINGSVVATVTDSFANTATQFGIADLGGNSANRWDEFRVAMPEVAVVNHQYKDDGGSPGFSQTITLTTAATAGNKALLWLAMNPGGSSISGFATVVSVSGLGATWSQVGTTQMGNGTSRGWALFTADGITGGSTITVTYDNSTMASYDYVEFLGADSFEASSVTTGATATAITPAVTPATPGDLVFGGWSMMNLASGATFTITDSPSAWTQIQAPIYSASTTGGWLATGRVAESGSSASETAVDNSANGFAWGAFSVVVSQARPTFVSASYLGDTGFAGTLAVPAPANIVAGNLLIAVSSVFQWAATPPSGWTVVENADPNPQPGIGLFYRYATASEPSTYTFTDSSSTGFTVGILQYSGTASSAPIDAYAIDHTTVNATVATLPSITTAFDNDRIVVVLGDGNAFGWAAPGELHTRIDYVSGGASSLAVWDQPRTVHGSVGQFTSYDDDAGSGLAGLLVFAVKPPQPLVPVRHQMIVSQVAVRRAARG